MAAAAMPLLPGRRKGGAPSGQADTYPLTSGDGLTRTAPAHAKLKESRRRGIKKVALLLLVLGALGATPPSLCGARPAARSGG
eukprot:592235-Prymnesium_polylepis.1